MSFLTYAALYHTVLMLVGLATIFMGYRLLVMGVMPEQGSDVKAEAGKVRLTIKNAAPGTLFLFIGFGVNYLYDSPRATQQELTLKTVDGSEFSTTTRGENSSLNQTLAQAKELLQTDEADQAIALLLKTLADEELTLHQTLPVFTTMANAHFQENQFIQAATYSQLAAHIDSSYIEAIVIYAKSVKALNQTKQAIEQMQKVADIDIQYYSILSNWQNERNR